MEQKAESLPLEVNKMLQVLTVKDFNLVGLREHTCCVNVVFDKFALDLAGVRALLHQVVRANDWQQDNGVLDFVHFLVLWQLLIHQGYRLKFLLREYIFIMFSEFENIIIEWAHNFSVIRVYLGPLVKFKVKFEDIGIEEFVQFDTRRAQLGNIRAKEPGRYEVILVSHNVLNNMFYRLRLITSQGTVYG